MFDYTSGPDEPAAGNGSLTSLSSSLQSEDALDDEMRQLHFETILRGSEIPLYEDDLEDVVRHG